MAISTDYRDSRKSAYQQYAIASDFNTCKLPSSISTKEAASLGVAFVAASLALGICMGMDFLAVKKGLRGPDLLREVRALSRDSLPEDIRGECFDGIREDERAVEGDWIAIWGGISQTTVLYNWLLTTSGSSASGCCAVQLAKLAGLKVLAVIDVHRSGERMLRYGADLLVDRQDTGRAISIIRNVTRGKLRFGLDTIGEESVTLLAQAMQRHDGVGPSLRSHLVGLTGLPKQSVDGVINHQVPIKLFHEAAQVGRGLSVWLEQLLEQNLLMTPEIEVVEGGLGGINAALDKLRNGIVNGPRLVVPL